MNARNVAGRSGAGRSAADGSPTEREAKPAPPVTAAYLERVALAYLERYSASVMMLRQTLERRVARRCRLRDEDPAAFAETIAGIVERARSAGLVDDARFTAARAATLRRRGTSARGLSAKLAAKGVDRTLIAETLENERDRDEEEGRDAEAAAARAYAKRRRLGPFRRPGTRADHREKDLAAMARAGFSYGLAKAVVDSEPEDEAFAR